MNVIKNEDLLPKLSSIFNVDAANYGTYMFSIGVDKPTLVIKDGEVIKDDAYDANVTGELCDALQKLLNIPKHFHVRELIINIVGDEYPTVTTHCNVSKVEVK